MGDAPLAQARGHRLQHPGEGPVLQHLAGPRPRPMTRGADPDLDHVLMNVDPGDPLKQHSHTPVRLLQRLTRNKGKARRPPEPPDQYSRLTHAHAAAATGGTRHTAPAPN